MKLSTEEAASYLGVTNRTLANWRTLGKGPKFYKPSEKLTYYFKEDLDAWIKNEGRGE